MFKKIAAVQPLAQYELIVWFVDGEARLFDAKSLIEEREEFFVLKDPVRFDAVKLELGSSQTLAHLEGSTWVLNEVPSFPDQLAKCQAYFVRIAGATVRYAPTQMTANIIDFTVPLPVTMRGTPTSSATLTASANMAVYINSTAQTGFTFSVIYVDANAFCIRATKTAHGATGGDVVFLNIGNGVSSPTFLSLES